MAAPKRSRQRPRRRSRSGSGRSGVGRWAVLALAGCALFAGGLYLGSSEGGFSLPPLGELLSGGDEPEGAPELAEAPPAEPVAPPVTSSEALDAAAGSVPELTDGPAAVAPDATSAEAALSELGPLPPIPTLAAGRTATVALVIDDLGRSLADLDRLGALGVPVTYAVLPFERLTPEVASALAARGEEVLLHLPMEPAGGADPGPGALTRGMSEGELVRSTRAALDAVPGAAGVNNHMGSELSADRRAMEAVLGELGSRGLFFLDSRTSARSVGYAAALELGVPAAERQVFLDPDPRPEAVRRQLRRALALAAERGSVIAIGHPHPETLAVLAEEVPLARAAGFEFVPVSYLVDRTAVAAR